MSACSLFVGTSTCGDGALAKAGTVRERLFREGPASVIVGLPRPLPAPTQPREQAATLTGSDRCPNSIRFGDFECMLAALLHHRALLADAFGLRLVGVHGICMHLIGEEQL